MENFDIAKYLKEHQLGSYGILNHYVDIKPLKEEEDEVELNTEIPYQGPEHKLDGNGTEFKQAETVSEEETEFQRPLGWEDLDNTDIAGHNMEEAIDNLIADVKSLIDQTFPNDRGKKYTARIMVKKLWLEKLRDWKG